MSEIESTNNEHNDELDPLGSVTRNKLHLIADCSGSMDTRKIEALNNAIQECCQQPKKRLKTTPSPIWWSFHLLFKWSKMAY